MLRRTAAKGPEKPHRGRRNAVSVPGMPRNAEEVERIRKTTRTGRPPGELVFARLAERLTGRELVLRKRGRRKGRRRG